MFVRTLIFSGGIVYFIQIFRHKQVNTEYWNQDVWNEFYIMMTILHVLFIVGLYYITYGFKQIESTKKNS